MKVAGYCRVSTDKEDQANSFDAQKRYFREYIEHHPDWELYEIYADEGITGTSTEKRARFNEMIADAYRGEFRLILTKEVSRFSRNILDTIAYTRELSRRGIGVLFVSDGISTLDPDAELRLSIMASIAQEESRRTSARVKWGQTRQMERGVVFGHSLLGYEVKDGRITVEPAGAELVRRIFYQYGVEKKGTSVIARQLRESGERTYSGSPKWSAGYIVKILKNEKYVGDLVQKKTYTPDYLTHEKKVNRGAEAMVILRDHHEPIISRELWDAVQTELAARSRRGAGVQATHSVRYPLSGRIRCGECGAGFISRPKRRKDGTACRRWGCITAAAEGRRHTDARGNTLGCSVGRMLRDEDAVGMVQGALNALRMDREWILSNVTALAEDALRAGKTGAANDPAHWQREIERTQKKKEDMLDAFFSGDISRGEMQAMKARYEKQLTDLRAHMEGTKSREQADGIPLREGIRREAQQALAGGCETLCRGLTERITVFADRHTEVKIAELPMVFHFHG